MWVLPILQTLWVLNNKVIVSRHRSPYWQTGKAIPVDIQQSIFPRRMVNLQLLLEELQLQFRDPKQ